MDDRIGEWL
jgi:hypothetical protein